ncbi:hypothetical protein CEXT_587641 [Caerostris extrusa]|uniref:Uncharacterized protein n=1 Tax=Caerostris extrusa TaxID=172846 RepID=A0AAV4R1X9_CAEEX|nr:hypothetical protein CEXT_587641 [Caerostris extrusa]
MKDMKFARMKGNGEGINNSTKKGKKAVELHTQDKNVNTGSELLLLHKLGLWLFVTNNSSVHTPRRFMTASCFWSTFYTMGIRICSTRQGKINEWQNEE